MQTMKPNPAPVVPKKTMKLAVSSGKRERPLWVHLYTPEGLGKTTFAAQAPVPIFLDIEQGSFEQDVTRFVFDETTDRSAPLDWWEVIGALRVLATEDHPYKTVVVDTTDALEAVIHGSICKRDGKTNIEDYGYGRGHVAALDEWRIFVGAVERIRARGINVITLAHSMGKAFKSPDTDDYDRYQMKMHDKAAGLLKERADIVLFGSYETFTVKNEKTKRIHGVSTGARIAARLTAIGRTCSVKRRPSHSSMTGARHRL